MLPDYPARVAAKHRIRVDRTSLFFQFVLISFGALWIFSLLGSEASSAYIYGIAAFLFSSALLLPDLVEFGPVERTRVSTACCFAWPPLLALAEINRGEGHWVGVFLLAGVSAILYFSSRGILGSDVKSRRWRGLSTTIGFGLAIPIVLATSNFTSFLVIGIPASFTTIHLLLSKDGLEQERQDFSQRLKVAESRIIGLHNGSTLMQQPSSLLKTAREEGWRNPERGIELVLEAEREVERILSFIDDVEEIKDQSLNAIDRAEKVTGSQGKARRMYQEGISELENGSLRIAERRFREAMSNAEIIETHWQKAKDAIDEAELAISDADGHLVKGLHSTLDDAKKALDDENPEYALSIVLEIPSQMGDVEDLMARARISLNEAENEFSSSESSSNDALANRIKESKEALRTGNASLAIGLAEGVTRALRRESEARTNVQRAFRQVKSIEGRFPEGESASQWMIRLDEARSLAEEEKWPEADEALNELTKDLDDLSSRSAEAREMWDFLGGDWSKLRNRLDSSGIGPDNKDRIAVEGALSDSEKSLSEGRIDSCLGFLGDADALMEALRRLV